MSNIEAEERLFVADTAGEHPRTTEKYDKKAPTEVFCDSKNELSAAMGAPPSSEADAMETTPDTEAEHALRCRTAFSKTSVTVSSPDSLCSASSQLISPSRIVAERTAYDRGHVQHALLTVLERFEEPPAGNIISCVVPPVFVRSGIRPAAPLSPPRMAGIVSQVAVKKSTRVEALPATAALVRPALHPAGVAVPNLTLPERTLSDDRSCGNKCISSATTPSDRKATFILLEHVRVLLVVEPCGDVTLDISITSRPQQQVRRPRRHLSVLLLNYFTT
jgi:hypothetical protein